MLDEYETCASTEAEGSRWCRAGLEPVISSL